MIYLSKKLGKGKRLNRPKVFQPKLGTCWLLSTQYLDREGRQRASNIPATPILVEFQLIAPKTGRSSTSKRILISIQGLLHMSTF